MRLELGGKVDVSDAVGVGDAKPPLEPVGKARDAPPGGGVEAGIDALHRHAGRPALGGGEILDRLPQVAGGEQEALEALCGIDPNHMPEDRASSDLDQRLGHSLGALAEPRAPAPTKN